MGDGLLDPRCCLELETTEALVESTLEWGLFCGRVDCQSFWLVEKGFENYHWSGRTRLFCQPQ